MNVTLMLLLAARFMVPWASRVKLNAGFGPITPGSMTGPMIRQVPMIDPSFNLPHPQMQAALPADGTPRLRSNLSGVLRLRPRWVHLWGAALGRDASTPEDALPDTRISQQTLPPTIMYDLDSRQLLLNWADSFMDPFGKVLIYEPKTPQVWQDDKAMVLHIMRHDIARATSRFTLLPLAKRIVPSEWSRRDGARWNNVLSRSSKSGREMVGLIRKDPVAFFVVGPSAVDASVLALGIFSRGKLKDDSRGSLRNLISLRSKDLDGQARPPRGRAKKQFGVFAIEGLAEAPGLTERSARVLLSRIEKYAHQEHKMVVVSKRALSGSDGRDLTEYYVRLGFEKVEMEDGLHELVYTRRWSLKKGSSSDGDESVDYQQVMVGMNLWTGQLPVPSVAQWWGNGEAMVGNGGATMTTSGWGDLRKPANISGTPTSRQVLPPAEIIDMDSKQFLQDWADSLMDSTGNVLFYGQDEKVKVLHHMRQVISKATSMSMQLPIVNVGKSSRMHFNARLSTSNKFEMVGLFPKSWSSPVDGSVLALGIFSRGQLKDDSRGSLRNLMTSRSKDLPTRKSWWWPSKNQFQVFAVEGLVDGPGLPEQSAKVLLSRIEKYAFEEQRIVVVSKRAYMYIMSDGTDLTEYYVRLGFEKLEMEDGLQELVYTRRWSLKKGAKVGSMSGLAKDGDMAVENQQIMTGMNLQLKNQQSAADKASWALQSVMGVG